MPHPPESPPPSPPSTPDRPSGSASRSSSIESLEHSRPAPSHVNSSTPIIQKKRMHIEDGLDRDGSSSGSAVHGLNATLGLVIHGAADGIALGASSLSGRGSLGLVVFLAVLVHKGASPNCHPGLFYLSSADHRQVLPLSASRRHSCHSAYHHP